MLTTKKFIEFESSITSEEKRFTKMLDSPEKNSSTVISYEEQKYPLVLLQTYNPSLLLFYKGNISYDYYRSIAVVGTQKF